VAEKEDGFLATALARDLLDTVAKRVSNSNSKGGKGGADKLNNHDSKVDAVLNYVSYPDRDGDTAVHLAVQSGHRMLLGFLLGVGKQVDNSNLSTSLVNNRHHTPMTLAASLGRTNMLKIMKSSEFGGGSTSHNSSPREIPRAALIKKSSRVSLVREEQLPDTVEEEPEPPKQHSQRLRRHPRHWRHSNHHSSHLAHRRIMPRLALDPDADGPY